MVRVREKLIPCSLNGNNGRSGKSEDRKKKRKEQRGEDKKRERQKIDWLKKKEKQSFSQQIMTQNYLDVCTHMEHIINPFSQKQREGLEWKTNPGT